MKGAVSLVFLLLLACSALCCPSGAIEGTLPPLVGDPEIEIVLYQSEMWCDVEPGQRSVMEFTGEVNADITFSPRVQYLLVSMDYYAEGWPTSGTSVVMFTRADSTMPFSCTVKVPHETTSSFIGTLKVSGRWSYQPGTSSGDVDPAYASIRILPYSGPVLETTKRNMTAQPLKDLEFEMSLRNGGNAVDNITLTIEEIPSHMEAVFLTPTTMTLQEKGIGKVRLQVRTGSLSPEGHSTIKVCARGSHNGREPDSILVLDIDVETPPSSILGLPWWTSPVLLFILVSVIAIIGIVFFRKRRRSRRISR
ncbi:MAG: hypothetical protein QCI82_08015 [Candidatus Thermoplasmatota archaeon]|nr:hypothetical protein [Candidatus Thermoplasmatota archaeon]